MHDLRPLFPAIPLGEHLVVVGSDRLVLLNGTARLVWESVNEGLEAVQTARRLACAYGVSVDVTLDDIQGMLTTWQCQGLVGGGQSSETDTDRRTRGQDEAPKKQPDELSWPGRKKGTSYEIAGRQVAIHFSDGSLESRIGGSISHLKVPEHGETVARFEVLVAGEEIVLRRDGQEIERGRSSDALAVRLAYETIRFAYQGRDWGAVLHAGAVAAGDRCVVLVGPGGSGKSTLAAALVHAGMTYLADDVVPLKIGSLRAVPVPGALGLKEGSWAVLAEYFPEIAGLPVLARNGQLVRFLPPPSFDRSELKTDYAVTHLVYPRFRRGATVSLEPISSEGSLRRLIQAEPLLDRPLELAKIERLVDWVADTPAWELTYGDLDGAVFILERLLENTDESRSDV